MAMSYSKSSKRERELSDSKSSKRERELSYSKSSKREREGGAMSRESERVREDKWECE